MSYQKTDSVSEHTTGTELYFRELRQHSDEVRTSFSLRVRHLPDGSMDWVIQETTWKMGRVGVDKPYTRLIAASFDTEASAQVRELITPTAIDAGTAGELARRFPWITDTVKEQESVSREGWELRAIQAIGELNTWYAESVATPTPGGLGDGVSQ